MSSSSSPRVASRTFKIAVVGCGALGSYYGGRLSWFGQDVHFLLRSDYDIVRRRGVRVLSPDGDFQFRPRCARHAEEIGVCDGVLIGLKSTANSEFPRLLRPLVGPSTAVLTLQNGLGNEEALAALFSPEQILGGLCFVCLNRVEPGLIQHIAHGRISLGEYRRWPEPRTHDWASIFRNAGVPCEVTDNLARAHWEKLVWNIPFNGLGVAGAVGVNALDRGEVDLHAPLGPCLATDQLLGEPRWEQWVRDLMREVIAAARGIGFEVDAVWEERHIEHTRSMGRYRASTLIDFERGQPLELEALFLEPLRQARAAGVSTPRLERLCGVLAALEKRPGHGGLASPC
ncbi:MAG: 2-dehydropantoate 2-reductase [Verrucomicrobia bacterium]|nr:2-dehydropantoate 2-reductase [Verrucomicrobiota bacterium]MBI3869035.1 2-dehydropantoate 2-reductase [Verrucomicrobiota bacterium]